MMVRGSFRSTFPTVCRSNFPIRPASCSSFYFCPTFPTFLSAGASCYVPSIPRVEGTLADHFVTFIGETESKHLEVFKEVHAKSACIVVLDEVDASVPHREDSVRLSLLLIIPLPTLSHWPRSPASNSR